MMMRMIVRRESEGWDRVGVGWDGINGSVDGKLLTD